MKLIFIKAVFKLSRLVCSGVFSIPKNFSRHEKYATTLLYRFIYLNLYRRYIYYR